MLNLKIVLLSSISLLSTFHLNSQLVIKGVNCILHSHNDYKQTKPIMTALENNFNSIEVDIVEYQGKLIVSHDQKKLDQKPILRELYLEPIKRNELNYQIDFLFIDIKENSDSLMFYLHQIISEYGDIFLRRNQKKADNLIQLVLSGNFNRNAIYNEEKFKFFFIDGTDAELSQNYNSEVMPVISYNFKKLTGIRGAKTFHKSDISEVLDVIEKTKSQGKKVRFWGTPTIL